MVRLNPVKDGQRAKRTTSAECNYSLVGLRRTVRFALDSVSLDLILNYFRKSRDGARAYANGACLGSEMLAVLKVY